MAPKKIGRYKIEGLLGQGTMGVVFKAYDPALERHAAIKVMNTGVDVDDELRARFFREARSAAKLSHPNIISIFPFTNWVRTGSALLLQWNTWKGKI